ncbi:MAG TPA: hypothetical protein VGP06_12600 [Janthinobacterium sp.]|jgi:hypothetical protein|nr:hypothetical protein [Janthinobacterium sp.]
MKDIDCHSILALLKETGAALRSAARFGLRTLSRMSWPALLLSCVLLALFTTILPLAISLFAVFLLLKLLVAAVVVGKHRGKPAQPGQNGHAE